MRHDLALGLAAGAVGTVALNVATYLDMATRGRASSGLPARAAQRLADEVAVSLGEGEERENRASGLGALLGYLTGLGVGAAYGGLRGRVHVPARLAAVGLGVAAMTASDLPMTALGLTDPRAWGPTGWLSDAVPHLAYGAATAAAYELFAS